MRLSITHTTRVAYERPATEGVMLVRLGPLSDATQSWDGFSLSAHPDASIDAYPDAFGNVTHLITVPGPHDALEVTARSTVSTLLVDPLPPLLSPATPLSDAERFDYLRSSQLVPLVDDLAEMAAPFRTSDREGVFDVVRELMRTVYENLEYERFVTNVGTTAADALKLRRGVCQDFTHVLLGLCRVIDVPARYVSGYLVGPGAGASEADRSPSAASHAWVEAWTPTHGWRGFDATNNTMTSTSHVKMAVGRDYADVPPTRGTSRGSGNERLTIHLTVERLSEAPSQPAPPRLN
jgi:transglutaminase-like putative cysteine protease